MNYLFFDIECSNCLNGEGKICSFGFVLTDDRFQVIKKKDILVDPKAPFLLGSSRTGEGITLAYPLFRFRWAHTFPYYYQEIKKLLTDPNNLPIGFAADQDINFLLYTCERYHLEKIRFRYLDVQKLEKLSSKSQMPHGLDVLIERYQLEKHIYHRSDEDAYMTMEILLKLLKDEKSSLPELIERYKDALSDVDTYLKVREARKAKKKHQAYMKNTWDSFIKNNNEQVINLDNIDKRFYKKTIFIKLGTLFSNFSSFLAYKNKIKSKGAIIVKNLKIDKLDYFISDLTVDRENIKKSFPDCKALSFKDFITKVSK